MPRSFASSQLLRKSAFGACGLVGIALLTAGCGGKNNPDYSVEQVRAAFAAEGMSFSGSRDGRRRARPGFRRLVPGFGQESRAQAPTRSEATAQPLTAVLKGVRNALLLPTFERDRGVRVLRSPFLYVIVYPRVEDAQRKAASYSDILEAEQILDRVQFGYFQKANVVVNYTIFEWNSPVPGSLGRWDSPRTLTRQTREHVTAALGRLP